MQRIPISAELSEFPDSLQRLIAGFPVYDSSCSPDARVYFVDKGAGFFLKISAADSLKTEAEMTRFFHSKGLSAEVLAYESLDRDYLLTRAIPGEDCISRQYLENPKRLCDTLAQILRMLHDTDPSGCPVPDRTGTYLDTVSENYRKRHFDLSLFDAYPPFRSAEDAWQIVQQYSGILKRDTLLHGDYCLPNVMLNNWQFSGFIDVGNGGVGDRHIDLFWGAWTLIFNLKTDVWCTRFLDAYGREKIEPELLRAIAAFEVFG